MGAHKREFVDTAQSPPTVGSLPNRDYGRERRKSMKWAYAVQTPKVHVMSPVIPCSSCTYNVQTNHYVWWWWTTRLMIIYDRWLRVNIDGCGIKR